MKSMLLLLTLFLCAVAWRSEDVMQGLAAAGMLPGPAATQLPASPAQLQAAVAQKVMSVEELATLSKSDPKAYQKFMKSRTAQDPTEADKLMNFFARGKYE
jgi:hypothetical protein